MNSSIPVRVWPHWRVYSSRAHRVLSRVYTRKVSAFMISSNKGGSNPLYLLYLYLHYVTRCIGQEHHTMNIQMRAAK